MRDEDFFTVFPDRNYRIRKPETEVTIDRQRAAHVGTECEEEYRSLGSHSKDRRRIIVYRVPRDNPWFDAQKPKLLKVPMLLFADESIEDDDATLGPILHGIMEDARNRYG